MRAKGKTALIGTYIRRGASMLKRRREAIAGAGAVCLLAASVEGGLYINIESDSAAPIPFQQSWNIQTDSTGYSPFDIPALPPEGYDMQIVIEDSVAINAAVHPPGMGTEGPVSIQTAVSLDLPVGTVTSLFNPRVNVSANAGTLGTVYDAHEDSQNASGIGAYALHASTGATGGGGSVNVRGSLFAAGGPGGVSVTFVGTETLGVLFNDNIGLIGAAGCSVQGLIDCTFNVSGGPSIHVESLAHRTSSSAAASLGQSSVTLPTAGSSEEFPVLPSSISTDDSGGSKFIFTGAQSGAWFDPPTASGFNFHMTSNSLFTGILALPSTLAGPVMIQAGDLVLGPYVAGQSVDFRSFPGGGVSDFTITGITPLVDPLDPRRSSGTMIVQFLHCSQKSTKIFLARIGRIYGTRYANMGQGNNCVL